MLLLFLCSFSDFFGSLEKNWLMLPPLRSFSGSLFCLSCLVLFVPSPCLPSAGKENLYRTLLLVEDRTLDAACAAHDDSLLRRGFLLLAVAACWEELLSLVADGVTENQVDENNTVAAGKKRLLLVLPLQLRKGVAEEHPSSLLQ